MNYNLLKTLTLAALAAGSLPCSADTIALWNFNSNPGDANTGTGTTSPAIGSGSAALLNGVTASFSSGSSADLSTTTDNSGWQTTGYAAQGQGSGLSGALFSTSTAGYSGITVSFDLRTSNTSSRYYQFLFTTDGSTWTPAGGSTVGGVNNVFTSAAGDGWNFANTVDLSGVSGVNNNPNFAFEVVAVFNPASSPGAYTPATDGKTYAASGTYRFDDVSVTGSLVTVPEPSALALIGLGAAAVLSRRRH